MAGGESGSTSTDSTDSTRTDGAGTADPGTAGGAAVPGAADPGPAGGAAAPGAADPAMEGTPAGVLELLGLLAYAELVAFFRLSEDAALAPSLADKAALAEMAVAEFGHFQQLRSQITRMGAAPEQAMLPFVEPLDAFHARTAPGNWLEGLVKAYVGDGIAADFYRAVAALLDPPTRDLVLAVLADTGHADFVITRVRAAVAADPAARGRLALWARRLVGEALAQAHRVVAERPPLARLLAGAIAGGGDQGEIGRMFARLTDAHDERMRALGLEP
jgi:tRNA-(MS[2]IO[6]A)-hydroxylase (MiaE)-like